MSIQMRQLQLAIMTSATRLLYLILVVALSYDTQLSNFACVEFSFAGFADVEASDGWEEMTVWYPFVVFLQATFYPLLLLVGKT